MSSLFYFFRFLLLKWGAIFAIISLMLSFLSADAQTRRAHKGESDPLYYIQVDSTATTLIKEARLHNMIEEEGLPLILYREFSQKMLSYFENNGYPFAQISLQDIVLDTNRFGAILQIDKGNFIVYDTIVIRGDLRLNKHFFKGFCNFKKGKMYREDQMSKVSQILTTLPFAQEVSPASIEFSDEKASLYLFLEKRKTNQFDGYVGLVPVNEQTGKVAISGELQLQLANVLKQAETIALHWRATERYSQYLNIAIKFPYLFSTPFGIDGQLELDKKDTSYLNMNYVAGINYSFSGMNYLKLMFDYSTSNVLLSDTLAAQAAGLSNTKRGLYGVEFLYEASDFLYNPRRGYSLYGNVAVGNSRGEDIVEATGEELRALRYRLIGRAIGYIPLAKRWVLALEASGGTLLGEHLLYNEIFRLGGMHSLQGFDDRSITASSYTFGKIELRFLVAKITYISAFFNGGWYERNLSESYHQDFPFGFGLGMNFETKAGLFYISYALGKVSETPLSFRNGKIHFGLNLKF